MFEYLFTIWWNSLGKIRCGLVRYVTGGEFWGFKDSDYPSTIFVSQCQIRCKFSTFLDTMPLLCYYGPQLSEIVNLNKYFIFYVSLVIVCHQSYTTVTYIKVSNTECIIDSHSKSRVCVWGRECWRLWELGLEKQVDAGDICL